MTTDMNQASGIPSGFHSLTPHLVVAGGAAAIDFYKKAFGAVEHSRLEQNGRVINAQLQIGNSMFMLVDEFKEWGSNSPLALNGTPVSLHLYVENADEAFQKAVTAGATGIMPVNDMFWGDRYGVLKDPFGHTWSVATKVREVTPEELKAGAEACCASSCPAS